MQNDKFLPCNNIYLAELVVLLLLYIFWKFELL